MEDHTSIGSAGKSLTPTHNDPYGIDGRTPPEGGRPPTAGESTGRTGVPVLAIRDRTHPIADDRDAAPLGLRPQGSGGSTPAPRRFPELTDREREILSLITGGEGNVKIDRCLGLSTKTVANHVSNILTKLQVLDRAEAIALARKAGLDNHEAR